MSDNDEITMGFKEGFHCSRMAASERDRAQALPSNAEESEVTGRMFCEGFTARLRIYEVPDLSSTFAKRAAKQFQKVTRTIGCHQIATIRLSQEDRREYPRLRQGHT
jgi:hypothetical protein